VEVARHQLRDQQPAQSDRERAGPGRDQKWKAWVRRARVGAQHAAEHLGQHQGAIEVVQPQDRGRGTQVHRGLQLVDLLADGAKKPAIDKAEQAQWQRLPTINRKS